MNTVHVKEYQVRTSNTACMVMSVTAVCYLRCIIFPSAIVLIDVCVLNNHELELLLTYSVNVS